MKLGELPGEAQRPGAPGGEARPNSALEGVMVDELTPEIARQLDLPAKTRGVVVTQVRSGAAAEAGLRPGDVIQEVNRKPVMSVAEFERAIRQAGSEPVLLLINRGGSTLFLVVKPQ